VTTSESASVLVDTMVVSWLVGHDPLGLKNVYRELIGDAKVVIALQTLAELRTGALQAGWGELRRLRLERSLADFTTARPDDATATVYATVRNHCRRIGHALAEKIHDGDRWIAAAALQLRVPLVSHDALFRDVPGLAVISAVS
jgi:predicted nucleic acid-binding protein